MTSFTSTASLPVFAVGDGAGIRPEVSVAALLDDATRGYCNPIVIGDAKRLRRRPTLSTLTPRSSQLNRSPRPNRRQTLSTSSTSTCCPKT